MFDQVFISQESQSKRWMTAAFSGQVALITLALMTPLFFPEALRMEKRFFGVVAPPAAPLPPAPARTMQHQAEVFVRTVRNLITIPGRRIQPVAVIFDPPEAGSFAPQSGPCLNCVPGGIPNANGADRIFGAAATPGPPPPPPPAKPEPVKVSEPLKRVPLGGQVLAAKAISRPQPIYPPLAKQARIQGVVKLHSVIAKDGTVQGLRVISGHPLLVGAAVDAVRRWTYHPTRLNGEPVEVEAPIDVNFILSQ